MIRLLTCDTAIADVMIPVLPDNPAMTQHWLALDQALWRKQGTSKVTIDEPKRNALLAELGSIYRLDAALTDQVRNGDRPALHTLLNQLQDKKAIDVQAGGTALNIVQTLAKAFNPNELNVTLLTALGTGPVGDVLRSALAMGSEQAVTHIEPPASNTARTAMSLVYTYADPEHPSKTKRDIAKYDGHFKDAVTPANIKEAMAQKADAVLLLGTLLQKNEAMFGALLNKATHENSDLYFAMPTAKNITKANHDIIKDCLNQAKVVLSNYEEIGFLFEKENTATEKEVEDYLPTFSEALAPNCKAFITRGPHGAWTLEKNNTNRYTLTDIPLWSVTAKINPPAAKNTVGAGDHAFAGFLIGHLLGHSAVESAHMGMKMAHQRLMDMA